MRWSRIVLAVSGLTGCFPLHYVSQAAAGHMEMVAAARPLDEVLVDPQTPDLTRHLLSHVPSVRTFARNNGLHVSGNYEYYVKLDRKYPIWFVNASHPLRFQARTFRFPILGSFPGLSWFSESEATEFADRLKAKGWDVNIRGVGAFSTGGWFDDPIVWSMLSRSKAGLYYLINTVLHESVHATVLVKDQQYFNESLASFVANTMTSHYLQAQTGQQMPPQLLAYLRGKRRGADRAKVFNEAYQQLDAVYRSQTSDSEKLKKKRQILDALRKRLKLKGTVNNATLIGFRLYQVGRDDFSKLFAACGHSWRRFLTAVSTIPVEEFGRDQQSDIGPVVDRVTSRGCPTKLFEVDRLPSEIHPWRSKQRRRLAKIWGRVP